jgi:hypothetical protein
MTRLALTLTLLAACGGSAKPSSTAGAGSSSPVLLAKRAAVSWGIEPHGEMSDVFLATTDETGKQVSHSLGRYKGTCKVITPAAAMKALTAVACLAGPNGTELDAVVENGSDIVILQSGIDQGVTPDPMARNEVMRVKVEVGTKIELGS